MIKHPSSRLAAPASSARADGADRESRIRAAAFALYEQHGSQPGHDLDDWLQAEAQVDAELARGGPAPSDPDPGTPGRRASRLR